MRCLTRNKRHFYYALYQGKEPVKDASGNRTGETKITYSNPICFRANISAAKGESETMQFGDNLAYDKVIVFDKSFPSIDEFSILWVDTVPVIKPDGTTDTPNDYIVKKVAKSLNHVALAISKVNVG